MSNPAANSSRIHRTAPILDAKCSKLSPFIDICIEEYPKIRTAVRQQILQDTFLATLAVLLCMKTLTITRLALSMPCFELSRLASVLVFCTASMYTWSELIVCRGILSPLQVQLIALTLCTIPANQSRFALQNLFVWCCS